MGFNYLFDIPDHWQDNVTARKVAEENKIVFYSYDRDLQSLGEELLSIKVVNENSKAETEKRGISLFVTADNCIITQNLLIRRICIIKLILIR